MLVPASASRQYQPYLDELLTTKPDLPLADGVFSKPAGFQAGDKGRTYEQVLDSTVIDTTKLPAAAATAKRLWIIDDIYNTGSTVGAMLTRLEGHLPALEEVFVVSPLYVPLGPGVGAS